jgi:glycosyltransferase involved in cell wall biosynthesis
MKCRFPALALPTHSDEVHGLLILFQRSPSLLPQGLTNGARFRSPVAQLPMTPTVSVVIPVYNRFERLKYAVESVLTQTLRVSEVILVDDGSIDNTSEQLPRYIAQNQSWRERVICIHQENQGPNVARNQGIRVARGEWLAFNDNDDIWLPQKLEWQFRALEQFKDQCSACITDAWFMNNPCMKMTLFQLAGKKHNGTLGIIPEPLRYILETRSVVGVHPVWLQNLLTRTELARRVGGFDPNLRFGDDDDFAFRLVCETGLCFVNMPLVVIDRTPPTVRHVGVNTRWDDADFRLEMAQSRYEKRLRMSNGLPNEIRKSIRKGLAAVYSGWANWFLDKREYSKALEAIGKAASTYFTPTVAVKWALTRSLPAVARKLTRARHEHRNRKIHGIG